MLFKDEMDVVGIIGFVKGVCESIKAATSAYDQVYSRALRRWTCNSSLRERFADNYLADFDKLIQFVKNNSSVRPGLVTFFKILLDEIKKDPATAACISAEFSIESFNLLTDIRDDVSHIKNVVEGLACAGSCEVPEYADVEDYIHLNVTYDETDDERLMRILSGQDDNKSLCDLILDGEKHIILFSHPQYGKSTVLSKLAYDLQQSNIYKPFLFNLRNYSSRSSLSEQTKLEQRLDNSSFSVLILDGLDELRAEHREDVVSEIASLSENYPLLNIVLSCRLSHKKYMTVNGFKSVYLKSMSWDNLRDYVYSHCADPEGFLRDAADSRIMELFYVPFFLKESVRYFQTYGKMPADKVDLYNFFIERTFDADGQRKLHRTAILGLRSRLYPCLEHLAFVMIASQRMELAPDDLVNDMDLSLETVEFLMGLSLITKGDNGELTFVHNAFKEYILAKKLAQLPLDEIKSLICYPDTDMIIPAMKNVAVLLVHIICTTGGRDASDFRLWFVEKHPEILVEVGPDYLDSKSREDIFLQIYNDHKAKGLFIEYSSLKMLMNFASTQGSVDFVLREIENSDSLDVNCMNALRLAEYADFSLLSPDRRSQAEEVFLSLLEWKRILVSEYAYLSLPLTNKTILTEDLISRVMERIHDTKNCYLVRLVCSMAVSLGVSDQCVDWVMPKAKYICNFDENGATHVVSDYRLMEFINSLSHPDNILAALRFLLPSKHYYTDSYRARDKWEEIPGLLSKLSSLPSENQCLDKLIAVVDSAHLEHMPRKVSLAFRCYFESVADVNELFERRLQEIIESNQTRRSDFYSVWRMHNLLSILLDKDVLTRLMEQDNEGEFAIYNVLSHLVHYSARTEQEIGLINEFGARKFPKKSQVNTAQDQFNILFDRSGFEDEVYRIFEGKECIDVETDIDRIYQSGYNSSVISFLREFEETDKISLGNVLESFNDSVAFSVYVAYKISSFEPHSVIVSDEHKSSICDIVHRLIPLCEQWNNLNYSLVKLIVNYDLVLSDEEFMMLFAWSGVDIKDKYHDGISYRRIKFMDFLYGRLSDKSLFVRGVRSALAGELEVSFGFYEAVAEVVVKYHIADLYREFHDLVLKFKYSHEILNALVNLLQLGNKGLSTCGDIFYLLSEDDKLYFIEKLLSSISKGKVLSETAKTDALEYIEANYETYQEPTKQRALRILFANGRESALKWGLRMFDDCDTWLYADDIPSLSGYSGQHYEYLEELFHQATGGEQKSYPRPQPMYESIATALKNIAMESTEMLEKVKRLFRSVAKEKKDFRYYNRVADELDIDFYSKTVPVPSLREASELYKSL